MTDFLPANYAVPVSSSERYFKLAEGDNKFRILDSPIVGWKAWDKTGAKPAPVQAPRKEDLPESAQDVKYFWALPIFSYRDNMVVIWQPTQRSLISAITELAKNDDWGSPTLYDINIKRQGSTLEDTEYSVVPIPPKPMTAEIKAAWAEVQAAGFDLSELFRNGDPFAPRATEIVFDENDAEEIQALMEAE